MWIDKKQKAFDLIKNYNKKDLVIISRLLKIFDIYTDGSYYQLGMIISQNGKSIAFYSSNLKVLKSDIPQLRENCLAL